MPNPTQSERRYDANGQPIGNRVKCGRCTGIGLNPWANTGHCWDCNGAGWVTPPERRWWRRVLRKVHPS